jgi:dipeptidyl aminopeptidase/acylaminoacyl peptidase
LGGLLFHPDFYTVAVSSVGCHDNRMDKIWWNEQWMGWPIGPHYSESSNVDNAHRLQGRVLLVVGELDRNVDPSSTMQVVKKLIEHNKDFDLLVIPGAGHGSGGAYGEHRRFDYFVRHLLGVDPPAWSDVEEALKKTKSATTTAAR